MTSPRRTVPLLKDVRAQHRNTWQRALQRHTTWRELGRSAVRNPRPGRGMALNRKISRHPLRGQSQPGAAMLPGPRDMGAAPRGVQAAGYGADVARNQTSGKIWPRRLWPRSPLKVKVRLNIAIYATRRILIDQLKRSTSRRRRRSGLRSGTPRCSERYASPQSHRVAFDDPTN